MKILIITYSREVNPGTFLQAYGVQLAMKQLFPDAHIDLLKHKRLYGLTSGKNKSVQKNKNWTWLKSKIAAIPRRIKYEWCYARKFTFTKQEFDFFPHDNNLFKKIAESYDLIVVGSDTILINLKKNNNYGLMWLLGIQAKKILFAASAAPAGFDSSIQENNVLKKNFDTFLFLGVRDSITKKIFAERFTSPKNVIEMFDPTFLIPEDKFKRPWLLKKKILAIKKHQKIALVNFGNEFKYKKEITQYMQNLGFYVISTHYNIWANKNIMTLSPFEWAGIFCSIDMCITERFHDATFSLRNNKPTVAIDWNPARFNKNGSKLQDLLKKYDLEQLYFSVTNDDEIKLAYNAIKDINKVFSSQQCITQNKNIRELYKQQLETIRKQIHFG